MNPTWVRSRGKDHRAQPDDRWRKGLSNFTRQEVELRVRHGTTGSQMLAHTDQQRKRDQELK